MQITNGKETIDFPCSQWLDAEGNTYPWPQLAFLLNKGFTVVPPEVVVEVPYVPATITRRQGRKILDQYNLLASVEAVVATLDIQGQIDYQDASTFDRSNPVLLYVTSQAGMTESQIDAMFVEASTL